MAQLVSCSRKRADPRVADDLALAVREYERSMSLELGRRLTRKEVQDAITEAWFLAVEALDQWAARKREC